MQDLGKQRVSLNFTDEEMSPEHIKAMNQILRRPRGLPHGRVYESYSLTDEERSKVIKRQEQINEAKERMK